MNSFVETNTCSSEDMFAVVILGKLQGLCGWWWGLVGGGVVVGGGG